MPAALVRAILHFKSGNPQHPWIAPCNMHEYFSAENYAHIECTVMPGNTHAPALYPITKRAFWFPKTPVVRFLVLPYRGRKADMVWVIT